MAHGQRYPVLGSTFSPFAPPRIDLAQTDEEPVDPFERAASELDSLKYMLDSAHNYFYDCSTPRYDKLYESLMCVIVCREPPATDSADLVSIAGLHTGIVYTQSTIVPLNLTIRMLLTRLREMPEDFASTKYKDLAQDHIQNIEHSTEDEGVLQVTLEEKNRSTLLNYLVAKARERHEKRLHIELLSHELKCRFYAAYKRKWSIMHVLG